MLVFEKNLYILYIKGGNKMSKEEFIQLISNIDIDNISYFTLTYFTNKEDKNGQTITFE